MGMRTSVRLRDAPASSHEGEADPAGRRQATIPMPGSSKTPGTL